MKKGWIVSLLITIFCLLFIVLPLGWILISSFKNNFEFFTSPYSLPYKWSLENYITAFYQEPFLRYLFNSISIACISSIFTIVITQLASYIFLFEFPFKRLFYLLIIFGLFVPLSAFMLPYYLIVETLGLYDSIWGLILVYTGISVPLSFLIINTYMREIITKEVIEAAYIDGASFRQIFLKIVTPMSVGGMVTSLIFLIINAWNELLYALLLTQSESSRTIQVAIRFLLSTFSANYPLAFAAIIIGITPVVVAYIFLNKHIITGLAMINK